MKIRNSRFERCLLAACCAAGAVGALGVAHAVQVAGGGIGTVIAGGARPAPPVAEPAVRAPLAATAPLSLAQPRPWGGMKLDANPFPTARLKR